MCLSIHNKQKDFWAKGLHNWGSREVRERSGIFIILKANLINDVFLFPTETEAYPQLQSIVSSLTAGPVGPGDMVGGTNKTLLMRCCAEDGLILKPSRPARVVNDQFIQVFLFPA